MRVTLGGGAGLNDCAATPDLRMAASGEMCKYRRDFTH
jgi:hypothetical protein